MSIPWNKKFRITLWGIDVEPIPLSRPQQCRDGVGLREVPEGLSGHSREHTWDSATGAWRGINYGPRQFTLDLIVRGSDVRGHVDRLLTALGDGTRPIGLSVVSGEWGYRWHRVRVRDVSSINWHTSPGSSPLATLSVVLEFAGAGGSRRFTEEVELTSSSTFGEVPIRVDGDQPVWPKFIISGRYKSLRLRLTAADEWQTLPYDAAGWIIDSHPERRHVTNLNGVPYYSAVVPFWPEPIQVSKNVGKFYLEVDSPAADFKTIVQYVPEMSRTW